MKKTTFHLDGQEFIELNKLLKITRLVGSGGEANAVIEQGYIIVNKILETRKRNKLKVGDEVQFQDVVIEIV